MARRPQQQPLLLLLVLLLLSAPLATQAFHPPLPQRATAAAAQRGWTSPRARARPQQQSQPLQMVLDPVSVLGDVSSAPSTLLAAEAWVAPAKQIIEPILDLGGVAFLIRIILSWYPQIDLNKTPVNLIAWPTEPFLKVTRLVVPPAFGVDVSPIIWFAFLNFLREILISDQGILTILSSK